MDLIDRIKILNKRVQETHESIETEEATKTAFIMPFINALGYDVFNPNEVVPEYTADVGTKKGEKVDFAILKDGTPIILVECKWCRSDLKKEKFSQLYRYFSVTKAKFAVLTNGITYRFFTDSCEPNKMDTKPFFEFNLLNFNEAEIDEIKKFSKNSFDVDETYKTAVELKYIKEIKKMFVKELLNPSDNLVKFFASAIYHGKVITKNVRDEFRVYVKKALNQYVNDKINERFKTAIEIEDSLDESKQQEEQKIHSPRPVADYLGKKPLSFSFLGKTQEVKYWKDILIGLVSILWKKHPDLIHKAVSISGRTRKYFSKKPDELKEPKSIEGSDYFVESNFNPKNTITVCKKLIKAFGYNESDFSVEVLGESDEPRKASSGKKYDYRGKKPLSFTFLGQTIKVNNWKDMLVSLTSLLWEKHPGLIQNTITVDSKIKKYFTRNPKNLGRPALIGNSGYYVETNLASNNIISLCHKILKAFGYDESDFSLDTR